LFWSGATERRGSSSNEAKVLWPFLTRPSAYALLRDVWDFPPQADWQLAQLRTVPGLRLVVLKSDADINNFLEQIQ
jgi:hypothetical protein